MKRERKELIALVICVLCAVWLLYWFAGYAVASGVQEAFQLCK